MQHRSNRRNAYALIVGLWLDTRAEQIVEYRVVQLDCRTSNDTHSGKVHLATHATVAPTHEAPPSVGHCEILRRNRATTGREPYSSGVRDTNRATRRPSTPLQVAAVARAGPINRCPCRAVRELPQRWTQRRVDRMPAPRAQHWDNPRVGLGDKERQRQISTLPLQYSAVGRSAALAHRGHMRVPAIREGA